MICFWNYSLQKAALFKCLESPISEKLWTVDRLKGPKHCLNLQGSIFVRFFDDAEWKSAQKTFFLVVSEILGLFLNILTSDEEYSLSVKASV